MSEWDLLYVQPTEGCGYSLIILVIAAEHIEILKAAVESTAGERLVDVSIFP